MSYQSGLIDELRERAQVAEALLATLTAEIDAKGGEVSARDLLGMWDVARVRADTADAEVKLLKGTIAAQDARDLAACEKAGIPPQGCDTSDELADEVLALKAQLDALQIELTAKSERSMNLGWEGVELRADIGRLKGALANIASQLGGTVAGCSVEFHCQVPAELAKVLAKVRGVAQLHADFACTNASWTEGARRAGHAVLAALPGMAV